MGCILLNKNNKFYIDNKFYVVNKGRVITRNILENGKIITNEICLTSGDVICNFFSFLSPNNDIYIPEIDIEIESLENETEIEVLDFNLQQIKNNLILYKLIEQLCKKLLIKLFYHLYNTQGYILAILKLYTDENGLILKKNINYENFNISRSQFYLIISKLKKEKFILEFEDYMCLNLKKVNLYLSSLSNTNIN